MGSGRAVRRMVVVLVAAILTIASVSAAFVTHVDGATGARGDEVAALGTVPCCD